MRKKKFLSIAVSLLFVLQIFVSSVPLESVKADTSTFPLVTENTSTPQGENGGGAETAPDQDGSVTQEESTPAAPGDSDNTAQQGTEQETEGTNGSSENGTQQEETDSQQNAHKDSGSDISQSEGNTTTDPEQSSATQDQGTTDQQTETPPSEDPVSTTPTVIEFPFITGGTLTDGSGKDISTETDVDKSSDVNVNYDFSIPEDQTVAAGTSYSIQITDQIKVKDASSEVKNSDGTAIGSISVDQASNKVTVTFPDKVKGTVSGEFSISGQFDKDKIGNTNPVSVNIGKASVNVNFKQEEAEQQNPAEKPGEVVQAKPGEQTTAGTNAVIALQSEPKDITNQFQFITGADIKTAKNENDPVIGDTQIAKNATIYAFYTWNIPNGQSVNEGDYYTMKLPSQFKDENLSNYPITDDDKNTIATMDISGEDLTLTFTSYVDGKSNVHGWFFIGRSLDENKIGYKNPENLVFYLQGGSESVNIPVNFNQPEPTVEKTGTYNSQAGTIDWTVTVNDKGVDVKNAKIVDKISSGQVLDDSSVKYDDGSSVDNSYTDGVLTCNLGAIGEKKTIKFTTSISADLADKPQGDYTYSNTAELDYGDDVENPKKKKATADVDVDVKLISKTGEYSGDTNKTIDWIITVNESGRSLGKTDNPVKITDTMPAGLKLIDGTVKIGDTKDTANTSVSDYDYTFTDYSKTSEFTYTLGNSITGQKVIKYSTSVDPSVYNSNASINYNNIAYLSGYGVKDGTSFNFGVGVTPNILEKDGMGYDAKTGRLKWKIIINKHQSEIPAEAVVTDTIPEGQAYVTGTASIDDDLNGSFTTLSDGEVAYKFTNSFSKTYTITFETQITDTKVYQANTNGNISYKNTAKMEAGVINQLVTANQNVNSNVITKTAEGYDYNSREISWKIVVNNNKMPITDATVTDVITSGQEYVDGSTIIDGNSVEDTLVNNPQNGTFIYKFSGEINESHTITFKTKLTDAYAEDLFKTQGKPEIKNTASVAGTGISTESGADTDSEGTQIIDNPVITKEPVNYTNGNSYIDWEVKTNANWTIPLAGATITDKLQDGLSLDTNTVELYKATVNSDGTLDQGVQVDLTADNIEYNPDPDDPDTMVFKFIFPSDAGTGAFILKFRTYAAVDGTYKNSVTFKGTAVTAESKKTQQAVSIYGGGGTGETGSITVVKVDSTDTTKKLPGAVFQLLDQYGNVIKTSAPTGGDGSAVFDKLKYDINYSIKEITAPTGYNLSDKIYTFKVNGADDQKNITYNFADTRKTGNVTFTKTGEDSDLDGLEGAEFTLYKVDGTTSTDITATSDVNGVVTFSNVPFGYKIKETKAPIGYKLSNQVLRVTVDASGNIIIDPNDPLMISDEKYKNNVTFTKKDQSGKPLKGAEFTLYKDDGTTVVDTATSDEDGKVTFDNVAYGYKIKETKAPTGYYLSSKVLTAKMKDAEDAVILDNEEFIDQKIVAILQGTVIIQKIDENGNPLKGAEFTLINSIGTPVGIDVTGDDGFARFYSVQPGQYTVRETKAPEGYSISAKEIPVQVSQSVEYDLGKFVDEKSSGSIEISKSDFSTQEPVPGATITIYRDSALTDVVDSKVTGADGKVVFDSLPYGHYYFKETGAPEGYKLNTDVHEFDISEDGKNVKDSITDEKISGNSFNIDLTANPNSITGDGKSTSTLTAKVVDADNKPVPGVTVDFSAPNGSFPDGSSAVTDENGNASVVFKSEKMEGTEEKKIPVTAVVNDPEHGLNAKDHIDITFEPGSIKGTVVDNETGNPIAGAKVVVEKDFDGDGTIDFKSEATTSADGKYEIAVPKGDVKYDVHITVPVQINGNTEYKTFVQKSNPGEIAGKSYDSEKTAAGIVLLKNPDGETAGYFKDYGNITIDVPEIGQQVDIGSDGTFQVGGLEKDKEYNFNIVYHFNNGEQIIIGKIDVKMDSDGQMRIDPEPTLIDPYGVVTDRVTGDKIPGADIKLYYADTERNAASGKTPDTLVQLPGLEGFPPADNGNPQSSDEDGSYAFMVYPDTDYYIVAEKPGYETLKTEIISVNDTIVKHDIEMNPIYSGGAGGGGSTNIYGTVNIKKIDENGKSLKGAEFTLFNSDENLVQVAVTDENGLAKFTRVSPGKYTVKETKAPYGYSISDKILPVEINQSKTYDLGIISDTKEEGSIPDPEPTPTPDPSQPGQNPGGNNTPGQGSGGSNQSEQPSQKPDTNQPGQSSSGTKGSNNEDYQENSSDKLPKTGSMIDTEVLLVIGIVLILTGTALVFKKKKKNMEN